MALLLIDWFNFILINILILFTVSIWWLFRDLPKLSKPWILVLISLLFFAVHYVTVVADELGFGNAATNKLIFQIFGTAFLLMLGLSLYLFRRAWTTVG